MVQMKLKNPVKTRILIAETGKSLREFAAVTGISHTYLSQILNGKYNPSPTVSFKIAKGLNVRITDIFLTKVVDESTNNKTNNLKEVK